jgi:excisionase family DNA binding protein
MTTLACRPADLSATLRRSYVGEGPEATAHNAFACQICAVFRKSYLPYAVNLSCYTMDLTCYTMGSMAKLINTAVFAARLLRSRKGILGRFKE